VGKDADVKLFGQSKPRYTVERNEDRVTIVMGSRRSIFHIVFYGVFILFWFCALAGLGIPWGMLFLLLITPNKGATHFQIFLFVFLFFTQLFHAYLGAKAANLLLREWMVKEIIEVDNAEFAVSLQIRDWRKTNTFPVGKIENLQTIKKPDLFSFNPPWRKRFEEKISFDCDKKTYRFGFWLKKGDADKILALIQKYLDEKLKM
jgi:hypothetical protein